MKIRKEYVIVLVVLFAMAGAVAAAYQVFYKTKWQQFVENKEKKDALESKLSSLETTFKKTKPEVLVNAYESQVAPLTQEAEVRSQRFSMGDVLKVDPVPEKEMARFYYEKQYRALMEEMQKIYYSRPTGFPFPMSTFGEPSPDQLVGAALTNAEVVRSVGWIKFGIYLVKFLRDAKAQAIYDIQLWRPREDYGNTLRMRTVGFAFAMNLADLVAFLESMRVSTDRYYSVESISIQNQALISAGDPVLLVQMVLTMGEYITPTAGSKTAAVSGGAGPGGAALGPGTMPAMPMMMPGMPGLPGMPSADPGQALQAQGFSLGAKSEAPPPPSSWQKFTKFLKQYFWPF